MSGVNVSPFGPLCARGLHDVTKPGAYLYRSSGNRECRECAKLARGWKPREGKTMRGTFG